MVQKPFKNSDRQIRGAIVRLLNSRKITRNVFHKELPFDAQRIDIQLERLIEEKMICKEVQKYRLP